MRSLHSGLRTVDVARRAGCSVQQVRNLERDGVLTPAGRTASGYRAWTGAHVGAARAYVALAAGVGPAEARTIMRVVHGGAPGEVLALFDAAHARLHAERRDLALTREAVASIAAEPLAEVRPADAMGISELAGALGVPASTLRHWEREGLLVPARAPLGGARSYAPADVRDARIVHQFRLAGHRIPALRALMPVLRRTDRAEDLTGVLQARETSINVRSRALLRAAAVLEDLHSGG